MKNTNQPKHKKLTVIKKLGIGLLAVFLAFIFSVGMACVVIMWPTGDGEINTKVWFPYMEYGNDSIEYKTDHGLVLDYSYDYIFELEKTPGKDFVVLNLTDVQKFGFEWIFSWTDATLETINHVIKEVKPDLITFSGDNVWGPDASYSNKQFIKLIDSFGIPWAPVFGNHDGEVRNMSFNYLADMFLNETEHCIFAKGPGNIGGVGNYVINITENGHIVQTFIMLDGHTSTTSFRGENGDVVEAYNPLTASQIEWYKWVVNGVAEKEGHIVESTVICHVPLPEFRYAYDLYEDQVNNGVDHSDEITYHCGLNREYGGHPGINSGMFDVMQELGSTKRFIAGHDHNNDSYITYHGIDLIYGVKTGDGCYWVEDGSVNGGTVLTIKDGGTVEVEQYYYQANYGTSTVSELIGLGMDM